MGLDMSLTKEINNEVISDIYWRKVNAIHGWFVREVQGGIDECERTQVKKKDLKKLLNLVKQVLLIHEKAKYLLPTTPGFFFGSQDYNDYYFESLEYTMKELNKILEDSEDCKFYYQSSW